MNSKIAGVFCGLVCSVASLASTREPSSDHLVPIDPYSNPTYRRLYKQKLFITPGEVARFVSLPSAIQPELAVSVYRAGAAGDAVVYMVTVTQPSSRLWDCIPTGDEKFTGRSIVDPRTIRTIRWDASLRESTANAIHTLWLAMLRQTKPDPCKNCADTDTSTEIFATTDSRGKLLEARAPIAPKDRTSTLVNLAFSVADYTRASASQRPALAERIERTASDLEKWVPKRGNNEN